VLCPSHAACNPVEGHVAGLGLCGAAATDRFRSRE
jgi:hypothetical protein